MILAIDQGTTGTTCLVVDVELRILGRGYRELGQHFPRPGWVEHDPEEIWACVEQPRRTRSPRPARTPATSTRSGSPISARRPWCGAPYRPAGAPRDRVAGPAHLGSLRGAARRFDPRADGARPDPYFSATKLEWILRHTERPQRRLAFGTIDSWLVWQLSGGAAHVTDLTNASRTMLLDLDSGSWDDELLTLFGVERAVLPEVVPSSGIAGEASLLGATVPISGIAGDQQAALRPGLLRSRRGEGDVRDRHVRARQPGRAPW